MNCSEGRANCCEESVNCSERRYLDYLFPQILTTEMLANEFILVYFRI